MPRAQVPHHMTFISFVPTWSLGTSSCNKIPNVQQFCFALLCLLLKCQIKSQIGKFIILLHFLCDIHCTGWNSTIKGQIWLFVLLLQFALFSINLGGLQMSLWLHSGYNLCTLVHICGYKHVCIHYYSSMYLGLMYNLFLKYTPLF